MSLCEKCGFNGELKKKFDKNLCSFCFFFSPDEQFKFEEYLAEKVPSETIDTFRKNFRDLGNQQKKGMINSASKGEHMSRPPFGYKYENGALVKGDNYFEVEEIFKDFLNSDQSLRQLAKKRSLSINGLKKILSNFTYIGKIKFDKQIYEGTHPPLVSTTLFNHVQDKLDKLKIKKV